MVQVSGQGLLVMNAVYRGSIILTQLYKDDYFTRHVIRIPEHEANSISWKLLFNKGFGFNIAQVLQESQERMQVLKKAESLTLLQSVFLYLEDHPI